MVAYVGLILFGSTCAAIYQWKDRMKWEEESNRTASQKYQPILNHIRGNQHEHPGKWAEIASFERIASGREAATRLRKLHPEFVFRSKVDQKTRLCKVYAMFNGNVRNDTQQ